MTTETSGSGDINRSLELLWGTAERPSRGPKPGLTLDRVVNTAVGIADAEGLGAVSMRRIATELGTGTMSLYRYVPGKAELLDLMLDRVGDTCPWKPPADAEHDWRGAIEVMAHGYLALYRAHPWLHKVNQARTVLGPSALDSMEAALAVLRGTRLRDPELISVIITVQSIASGVARMEAEAAEAAEATGLSHEEFWERQRPFLDRAMESGRYPLMGQLGEDTFSEGFDHFAFGLRRFVDGLEVLVRQRTEEARAEEERAGRERAGEGRAGCAGPG
ncbi:TetR/AcrR family transcriptional regulator [Streptomyces sp. NPDC001889]